MKPYITLFFILISLTVISQNNIDNLKFKDFYKINSIDTLDENYSLASDSIFFTFIPESGKSDIIAGEMLRILLNVEDEAMRNGNINWRREDKISLLFIYKTLFYSKIFPIEILEEVKNDINTLLKFRRPCTDQYVYIRIERRIIEYFWNKGDAKI